MQNPKIALIGAGSGAFSLSLIRDLCLTANLKGARLHFMDIDAGRLEGVYTLTKRYAAEIGMELDVHKTLDRAEALEGADFVINTALVAGHHRLRAGWEVARPLGYRHGGSLAIMHDEAFWIDFYQLQLFESLVQDILRICPKAWYFQVANSVLGGITLLARKYPQAKIVGLCHGYGGIFRIPNLLGLDRAGFTYEIPGVNHFIWATKIYYQGEDLWPRFNEWMENEGPRYWETCWPGDDYGPKAFDLYRRFGAFPIGDTCTDGGGSWGWWYHTDEATEKRWKQHPDGFWNGYFNSVAGTAADIQKIAADPSARVSEHFPPKMSGESMIPMIESIACGIPRTFIVNIQNSGGYVPGVPADFSVEVPALVSAHGIQGIQTDGLPPMPLAYLLRDRVAPVNLELEAYEKGSRKLLLELVRMDPWTKTEAQAQLLLDGILNLPFNKEMKEHYQ
jgi:alpha-galactosidase